MNRLGLPSQGYIFEEPECLNLVANQGSHGCGSYRGSRHGHSHKQGCYSDGKDGRGCGGCSINEIKEDQQTNIDGEEA
eukprot:14017543-Ditylum_brightwellii.AAC.1